MCLIRLSIASKAVGAVREDADSALGVAALYSCRYARLSEVVASATFQETCEVWAECVRNSDKSDFFGSSD